MAQQTTVELVDDLTGGKATGTVAFGLDGTAYEIDLNKRNEAALRKALAEFVDAAREVKPERESRTPARRSAARTSSPRPSAASAGPSPERKAQLTAIREWAAQNDIHVPARGRVPAATEQQFEEARMGRPMFSAAP